MIVQLRGSGGSGKSYVGHRLVKDYPGEELHWPVDGVFNRNKNKPKLVGHILPGGLFVIGPYRDRRDGTEGCGGADNIYGGPKVQMAFVTRAAKKFPFIFWESLMASMTAIKNYPDFMAGLDQPIVFPTLDTPAEECEKQMFRRNGGFSKGGTKPINTAHTIYYSSKRVFELRKAMIEIGLDVPLIDHNHATEAVVKIFQDAGWRP